MQTCPAFLSFYVLAVSMCSLSQLSNCWWDNSEEKCKTVQFNQKLYISLYFLEFFKTCDNRYENFPPFKSTPKAVTQRRVVASKINILQWASKHLDSMRALTPYYGVCQDVSWSYSHLSTEPFPFRIGLFGFIMFLAFHLPYLSRPK